MGGVAGHAGCFSRRADEPLQVRQALLNGSPVLSPEIVEKMTHAAAAAYGPGVGEVSAGTYRFAVLQQLGNFYRWDRSGTPDHGTSIWIDPTTRTFIILRTNSSISGKGSGYIAPKMPRL